MCGIVGIVARGYDSEHLRHELANAVASLHHRGPDDRGTWMEHGVAFGHTRLSILDLSPLARQPMLSQDRRFVIIFNGEIYNFADIREKLASLGHSFTGRGDTEVILHAFQEWGSDAVNEFIGMFAIALWDRQNHTLELVRDRIGVKPLYFGWHKGILCFASELKALRHFTHWVPAIDQQALGQFLQYGYVPDGRSIYKDVYKLSPGHRLILRRGKEPVVEQYWSITSSVDIPLVGNDRDIEGQVEDLLVDACRYRMVSDVPVGVYLSGGIDSSLVTALLANHHHQSIRTFTIGFREESHDESKWAQQVARHCGTAHTEYILEPGEALSVARQWGDMFDEPFADSSSIPTLLVSKLASRDVKVVLSADGGDELFSGYNSYNTVLNQLDRLKTYPDVFTQTATAGLKLVAAALGKNAGSRIHRWNESLKNPTPPALIDTAMSHWHPMQIRTLLGRYDRPGLDADYPGDAASQISLRDFHHYLPGDILTKVDRMTMLASIEGREPLLDHRIAELAFRLPPHLRRGTLGPKHMLKTILYRYVPREIVDRPKMGFAIPKQSWLRSDLRDLVNDFLCPQRIRAAGLMDWKQVQRIVTAFYNGDTKQANRLWFLLTFEMWRERWY